MPKLVLSAAAAGLTVATLAVRGPVTAHASSGPTGCQNFQNFQNVDSSNPEQHIGPGHHSFTHSSNNCVLFNASSDTAFLNNSNGNLMFVQGYNNTIKDFNNSNNNFVGFGSFAGDNSTSGNTLTSSNSNNNEVIFASGDVADTIGLLGVNGDFIEITGSGLYADVVPGTTQSCTVNSANAGSGTKSNPAIVMC